MKLTAILDLYKSHTHGLHNHMDYCACTKAHINNNAHNIAEIILTLHSQLFFQHPAVIVEPVCTKKAVNKTVLVMLRQKINLQIYHDKCVFIPAGKCTYLAQLQDPFLVVHGNWYSNSTVDACVSLQGNGAD